MSTAKRRLLWKDFAAIAFLRLFISLTFYSSAGLCSLLHSVPDLEDAMYQNLKGTPCVRLLNLTGEMGCSNPGRGRVIAPIKRFPNASFELNKRSTIVLPSSALHQFLYRALSDLSLKEKVAGLLVEFQSHVGDSAVTTGFSPDKKFPQAEFSPFERNYPWNPHGTGVLQQRYNFPVFLLPQESTMTVQEVALENEDNSRKHHLTVAEFSFLMQTTKSGTHNSESCLREWSCLPLGGYSVWSAVPPIKMSATSGKPIVLAVASMDSASFFRDMTPGADSSLSGMIALLAAVDALSHVADVNKFEKQLVILVLTGEAWGYLGSRRFLAELRAGEPSVAGINISSLHQILEVGSIGQALDSSSAVFYAHRQGGEISVATAEILTALQTSASSLSSGASVEVNQASKLNPGLPPSSLLAFMQQNSVEGGIVLEEFNESFKNKFYHSHLDDAANINLTAITLAASLVARTLFLLGDSMRNLSLLESIEVNSSLVKELVSCLVPFEPPGMSCDLVRNLITPTQEYANHYVGVIQGSPSSNPYPEEVDDTSRFVWNFLASRTGRQKGSHENPFSGAGLQHEECTETCVDSDEVCVGSTVDQKGHCVVSTTRYVPSYSPRLKYGSKGWKLVAAEPGDVLSEMDPVWTESFWKSVGLRIYLKESMVSEQMTLALGLGVTIGSYTAILCTKTVFRKGRRYFL